MPGDAKTIAPDLIRYHQALRLNAASRGSAAIVMLIIVNVAFLMALTSQWRIALIWLLVATSLVAVTRLYARFRMPDGITMQTAQNYIYGHMVITATTGLMWSLFAILATDLNSEISLIIASTFLISITLGGLLPGSVHRQDYLVMLSCALLPFPLWIIAQAESPIRFFGFGYLILYAVFFVASRKVHAQTIESIKAKINEASYAAQSNIVASIGHDLAQPLLAQRNYVELLSKLDKDGTNKEILDRLSEAQSSQEYLLNSLMGFESTKNGVVQLDPQVVEIDQLLTIVVAEFEKIGRSKGVVTRTQFAKVTAFTDAEIVKNCVRNLLSNAYKFTPADGTVTVTLERQNDIVMMSCADTGVGIAPEDHAKAFAPFVRLEQNDQTPGLGLGLASVKNYIELLGGRIKLTSELGKGATVELHFPIEDHAR